MRSRLKSAGALGAATAAVLVTMAGPAGAAAHAAGATTSTTSTTSTTAASVPTANPTSATVLSLTGFSSIAADSTHHQVFVSGVGSDPVAVTDFAGKPLTTLPALDGADALALSRQDGILYAAIGGTDEIAAVNTATLQEVAVYFTGTGHDPQHLAVVGNDIWFSYGSTGSAGIGVLDPGALTVGTTAESAFYYAPVLAASPSAPNTLVAGNAGISPSVIESFDVTSGAPVVLATSNPWTQSDGCENLRQLAITAGGKDVVAACGAPYYGSQLTLNTMTEDATYQTGAYPSAVAVAPASGTIAVGLESDSSVDLFTPGVSNPTSTYKLGGFSVYDLAWDRSGDTLFAVTSTATPQSSAPTLNVINVP
ncbi:hypothetical protein KGQ20_10615 [Catenulispora sp. NF23]|uniref:Lipoprotein n=1 Tax=Catenulispora pinistramenti TaxID=2705254 RepID=A0ABS5KJK7_9ACTN|nr:hypothetical protein [Catenulispora pinistramenti]MBS2533225.1 hypothetical protein [Catenulispora pinistramenti]MBS2546573.1 hypothetical protein [Catenulispora pinistramenti]